MAKRANGEGSLYRRPNGDWVACLDMGWSSDGRRLRRYVSARTKTEASRRLRELQSQRERGQLPRSSPPTVTQWFETYLSEVARKKVRPSTYARYRGDVERHIVPTIGRIRIDRLQPADLTRLYNQKTTEGLSPTSVRHLHAVIRRALTIACRWQLITTNVASLVEPPSATRTEIDPLTQTEARQLLAALSADPMRARWEVALLGLRQGEALGLAWEDVDLDRRTLTVRRALQRQKGAGLVFTEPKTARSRRTIPLPEPLVASLRAHRASQAEQRLLAGSVWRGSDCVFTTELGSPIDPRSDWAAFKKLLTTAGLRDVRLHDLRHTAASLLLLQGVSPRVVMEILGHSQIALTMNTYSHVAPELQVQAMSSMSEALWG